ncbi:1,4-dihydroxy-2-naphthoate polyprenyltransferase, partial [Escherichia coli]|nr:1,4-dihydroxy-2-naphthoate polyprenyltransferase [Escherichia coli]
MSIPSFLKLVEIQTKIASVFPFMLGTLFVVYQYDMF